MIGYIVAKQGETIIFQIGDTVVHPSYGAGVVVDKRNISIDGGEGRRYLLIDIKDSHNSTVMIPMDQLEHAGVREAIEGVKLIREGLMEKPRILDDNYRTRQGMIRSEVKAEGIRAVIRGFRDLAWREHYHGLTKTDLRLKNKLAKQITRELSVGMGVSKAQAQRKLGDLLIEALERHDADNPVSATE